MTSLIKYVPILGIVILALLVAGCTGSPVTTTPTSTPAQTSQTAATTATTASTDLYQKYLNSDPSKIQADSTSVNWEDFIKNP